MLIIRPEQFQAFQPVADAVFVNEAIEYLLEHHANLSVQLPHNACTLEGIPVDTLRKMVSNGIARARRHGLSWESNLLAFVVMMFVSSPNFDEHPLIQLAMEAREATSDERFDKIWDITTEENWVAASQQYDASAWNL